MAGELLITNVLVPQEEGYATCDVRVCNGFISSVQPSLQEEAPSLQGSDVVVVDGRNKMLLPGFVNAHTHSIQAWGRGLVKMLPLELWLPQQYKNCDPRSRDPSTSSHVVYLSALWTGVETILSGGTAIMDHLFVRNLEDVEAAVKAYKELGLRAFIAPMFGDMPRTNYIPLVLNAKEQNAQAKSEGRVLGGLQPDGTIREEYPPRDPAETKRILEFWTAAVEKFHRPEEGINIALGPVQITSCSEELMRGAVELRKKYNLAGHIHMLETRGQRLQSRIVFPDGGAVKWLSDIGWFDLPGTSCAHSVWLEDEEQNIMARKGAVAVHNPVANCRLGSGIAPLTSYLDKGMKVAIGCDGPASNDGQDLFEAMKLACILNPLTSPEYRQWVSPRQVIKLAAEGGAAALGLSSKIGAIKEGYEADMALYDLTALSLLRRSDPIDKLVLGRPSGGVGGAALHSVWARGRLILHEGLPTGVDLNYLREELMAGQPEYFDPEFSQPNGDPFEVEFRAAMGLDRSAATSEKDRAMLSAFPKYRVNYDSDIS